MAESNGVTAAKSAAQRKADERQRQREAGRVVVQVWVHPEDKLNLSRYIKRLNQRREMATRYGSEHQGQRGKR